MRFFLQRVAYGFLVFTHSELGKQWWWDDGGGGGSKRLGMEEMEKLPWLLFLKGQMDQNFDLFYFSSIPVKCV